MAGRPASWLHTAYRGAKAVAAKTPKGWLDGTRRCENGGCNGTRVGCGVDGRFICTPCRRDYKAGSYQKNQHNQWMHPLGDKDIPPKHRR